MDGGRCGVLVLGAERVVSTPRRGLGTSDATRTTFFVAVVDVEEDVRCVQRVYHERQWFCR